MNLGIKAAMCILFFAFGVALVVGWWLAKCDTHARVTRIRGIDWMLMLGVALMAGSTWWHLS